MKDTLRVLKTNGEYLLKDLANMLVDIVAVMAGIILLMLQLIATPFRYIVKLSDVQLEHAEGKPVKVEIEEVTL